MNLKKQETSYSEDQIIAISILKETFDRDYLEFFKHFWNTVESSELQLQPYIEYLAEQVGIVLRWSADFKSQPEDSYELLVNIAPGTAKSSLISKFSVPYLWTLNPAARIISGSYGTRPVGEFTDKILGIMNSDEFKVLYPELQLRIDNINKQANYLKGERATTSTGATIIGSHADIHLMDDLNKPPKLTRDDHGRIKLELGANLTQILGANSWLDDQLSHRKTDKEHTRAIYVQQRLHKKDSSAYLLNEAKQGAMNLRHINLPAILDKEHPSVRPFQATYIDGEQIDYKDLSYLYTDNLLDPVRMKEKTLKKQKKLMGSFTYSAQFLQSPKKGKGFIKPKHFEIVDASIVPDGLVVNFYSDTSEGKKNSDNMATIAWSLYQGCAYVWEVQAVVKPFPEYIGHNDQQGEYVKKTYDIFVEKHDNDYASKHFFEAKSSGTPYIQYMNALTPYRAIEDIPKGSKMDRVQLSLGTVESGRIKLVKLYDNGWIEDFLDECENFTGNDKDHDDRVDVLTGLIKVTDFRGSQFKSEHLKDKDKENDSELDDTF